MKKISKLLFVATFIMLFSACSQEEAGLKEKTPNPVTDPAGYAPGMVDLESRMKRDVQDATKKENKKIDDALEASEPAVNNPTSDLNNNKNNMEATTSAQKTLGDNSALVKKYKAAIIKTSLGDIKVKFYGEDAPLTVGNFLKLSQEGFYVGTKFHRIIADFMIQGGDPLSKEADNTRWGTGDPGYKFADEINEHKLVKGSLAMANSGPNTNGSQFFIVTAASTPWLDGKHTNFGEVVLGMDVVEKIEGVATGRENHPIEDVVVESVEVLEK